MLERRPRLAYPFTILTGTNCVRLIAGEDFRYTLTAPELDRWLPALLQRFTGAEPLHALLASLSASQRESALQVVQQLRAATYVEEPASALVQRIAPLLRADAVHDDQSRAQSKPPGAWAACMSLPGMDPARIVRRR